MTTRDVATTKRRDLVLPEFDAWVSALQTEASLTNDDDESFDPATILQAIITAEDFDQAVELQNSSLISGKNLVNRPHTIYDFKLRKSEEKFTKQNERSLGVFAIVEAAWEDGTAFNYGVGAANVVAILWQARQFGKLPGKYQLVGRETDNGVLLSLMPVKTAVKG
jgi:hypothetical protein